MVTEAKNNNYKDRRVFERFKTRLPVRFIDLKRNREGAAYTYDVSAKGLGLVSQVEVNPYTPMELWLDMPDKGEPLYTRGEVVWSTPITTNSWRVGINLERADLMGMSRALRS
jgi:hypothetical protein